MKTFRINCQVCKEDVPVPGKDIALYIDRDDLNHGEVYFRCPRHGSVEKQLADEGIIGFLVENGVEPLYGGKKVAALGSQGETETVEPTESEGWTDNATSWDRQQRQHFLAVAANNSEMALRMAFPDSEVRDLLVLMEVEKTVEKALHGHQPIKVGKVEEGDR